MIQILPQRLGESLKEQCREIFDFRFFSRISFPKDPEWTIRAVSIHDSWKNVKHKISWHGPFKFSSSKERGRRISFFVFFSISCKCFEIPLPDFGRQSLQYIWKKDKARKSFYSPMDLCCSCAMVHLCFCFVLKIHFLSFCSFWAQYFFYSSWIKAGCLHQSCINCKRK